MSAAVISKNLNRSCLSKWRDLIGSQKMPIDRLAGMILTCADAERHGRACTCQRVFFPKLVEAAHHPY